MSNFTNFLTITQSDDWRSWRIEQPLIYEVGALGSGQVITVPAGFVTDGASIPQLLWAIMPTWGRYSRAAVVHDFLYAALRAGAPHQFAPDRKTADGIFHEAMVVCGVNTTIRWLIWVSVRLFGGRYAKP
jgi:hypothetical protein